MDAISPLVACQLRHYVRPGLRYATYPPTKQLHCGFGETAFREAARISNDDPIPRRLSLSLRLPSCSGTRLSCDSKGAVYRDRSRAGSYLARLEREVAMVAPLFDRDRDVIQLHLGGGAPKFLDNSQLGELMESLHRHFNFSSGGGDLAVEIDPCRVDADDIEALAFMGFNRASIGVLDFDLEAELPASRTGSEAAIRATIETCRHLGFRSVNVDVAHGLPGRNRERFGDTLDAILAACPDRITVRDCAQPQQPFRSRRQFDATSPPNAGDKIDMILVAAEKLTRAGYCCISMGHFALPTNEFAIARERGELRRNLLGYTVLGETDQIGFGVGAISHVGDSYSQNARELPRWEAAIDGNRLPACRGLRLSTDDLLRADLIQQLLCLGRIDKQALQARYGIVFDEYFADDLERLRPLADAGLVECAADHIRAMEVSRLLPDVIASCFDAYLHRDHRPPRRRSRAT